MRSLTLIASLKFFEVHSWISSYWWYAHRFSALRQLHRCFIDTPKESRYGADPVKIEKSLDGMEVLVVDDGVDNQMLIQLYLQSAGAKVSVASSGFEGVEMATHHSYNLVLMDLQMPGMDGYEATTTLRRQGYSVPIVALSAHAMKDVKERCLAGGFSDYFSKPINGVEFIKKLSSYCTDIGHP